MAHFELNRSFKNTQLIKGESEYEEKENVIFASVNSDAFGVLSCHRNYSVSI